MLKLTVLEPFRGDDDMPELKYGCEWHGTSLNPHSRL